VLNDVAEVRMGTAARVSARSGVPLRLTSTLYQPPQMRQKDVSPMTLFDEQGRAVYLDDGRDYVRDDERDDDVRNNDRSTIRHDVELDTPLRSSVRRDTPITGITRRGRKATTRVVAAPDGRVIKKRISTVVRGGRRGRRNAGRVATARVAARRISR